MLKLNTNFWKVKKKNAKDVEEVWILFIKRVKNLV